MSRTATGVAVEVIGHLDFPHDVMCDYTNCSRVATHKALCPLCHACEFFCTPHMDRVISLPPDAYGTFDKSCGHVVRSVDVKFVPLR